MAASAFAVAAPNPAELAVTRATEFLVKGGIFKPGEGILVRVVLLESGRHELELLKSGSGFYGMYVSGMHPQTNTDRESGGSPLRLSFIWFTCRRE